MILKAFFHELPDPLHRNGGDQRFSKVGSLLNVDVSNSKDIVTNSKDTVTNTYIHIHVDVYAKLTCKQS